MTDGFVARHGYDAADPGCGSDLHTINIEHKAQVSMVIDFEKPLVLPKVNDI